MARKGKLTAKQKIFCNEYLIDINATRAYKAAYENVTKDETAAAAGARLLRNVNVQEYIQERMKDREKRTEITQDKVLNELAKIGFADMKDFLSYRTEKTLVDVDAEGKEITGYQQIVDAIPSDEVDGAVVNEVSIGKDGTFKFKLNDKMKALELLGKHLGMFTDRLNVNAEMAVKIVDDVDGGD